MAYRKRFCDDCGVEAPQNELHPLTRKVEVARESDTVQTFATGATGYRSGKVSYRTDHLLICNDCHDKIIQADLERQRQEEEALAEERARLAAEEEARARRGRWLLVSGAVVVVIGVGIVWTLGHAVHNDQATAATADASSQAVASAAQAPQTDPASVAAPTEASTLPQVVAQTGTNPASGGPPIEQAAAVPSSVEPTTSPTDDQPSGSPLKAAISAALSSGDETPWTQGRNSGTVSVGPQVQWRGRTCRTFGYTTNGVKSGVTTVCQVAGQGWQRVAG